MKKFRVTFPKKKVNSEPQVEKITVFGGGPENERILDGDDDNLAKSIDNIWPSLVDDFTHGSIWPPPKRITFLPDLGANIAIQRPNLWQEKKGTVVGLRKSEGLMRFRPIGVINKEYLQPLINQRIEEGEHTETELSKKIVGKEKSNTIENTSNIGDFSSYDEDIIYIGDNTDMFDSTITNNEQYNEASSINNPIIDNTTTINKSKIPWNKKKKKKKHMVTRFYGLEGEGSILNVNNDIDDIDYDSIEDYSSAADVNTLQSEYNSWMDWFWPKVGFPSSSFFFDYPFSSKDEMKSKERTVGFDDDNDNGEEEHVINEEFSSIDEIDTKQDVYFKQSVNKKREFIINGSHSTLPMCDLRWGEKRIVKDDGYPPLFIPSMEILTRLRLIRAFSRERTTQTLSKLTDKFDALIDQVSAHKREKLLDRIATAQMFRYLSTSKVALFNIFLAILQKGMLLVDLSLISPKLVESTKKERKRVYKSLGRAFEELFRTLFNLTCIRISCKSGMTRGDLAKILMSKGHKEETATISSEQASFVTSVWDSSSSSSSSSLSKFDDSNDDNDDIVRMKNKKGKIIKEQKENDFEVVQKKRHHTRNRSVDVRAGFGILKEKIRIWKEGTTEPTLRRSQSTDSLSSLADVWDKSDGFIRSMELQYIPKFTKHQWVIDTNVLFIEHIDQLSPEIRCILLELALKGEVIIPGYGTFKISQNNVQEITTEYHSYNVNNNTKPKLFFVTASVKTDPMFSLEPEVLERFTLNYIIPPEKIKYIFENKKIKKDSETTMYIYETDVTFKPLELIRLQTSLPFVFIDQDVKQMINDIISKIRNHTAVKKGITLRASTSIYSAARAYAVASGKTFITPSHVKNIVVASLSHHIILRRVSLFKKTEDLVRSVIDNTFTPV